MRVAAGPAEVIPSARRLIRSLRDMGYDFSTAVADLIDNSIEADATEVVINVEFSGDDSWVEIADNGKGMESRLLREAMRYGSERHYTGSDLGRFGLGLKTASMSQCQRLTVASRPGGSSTLVTAYSWDTHHIQETDRWEIVPVPYRDLPNSVRRHLRHTSGTVAIWQRLDRILGYKYPYGEAARKKLAGMCRDLEQHLAMVFHRFMEADAERGKLRILLNGNEIRPWDPFARSEPRTVRLQPVQIPLEHEDSKGTICLQPFVLPHQNSFSSPEAFKLASGPANWNQQQGFYVYRADRMIQSGGWCRLRTADEHTKLARIAMCFSPDLDEAFRINVSKMRIQLPPQIRDQIDEAIRPVLKLANEVYRGRNRGSYATAGSATVLGSGSTNTGSAVTESREPTWSTMTERWTLEEIQQQAESLSSLIERPVIRRVFARLRNRLATKTGTT